jgi:hypothetical protein
MEMKRNHFIHRSDLSSQSSRRFFFWPFKKKEKFIIRKGAMQPDEVKRKINQIGIGNQIEILRIGYDGTMDDMPVIVEIMDIFNHGFIGRIINLERSMIEGATRNLVYAKKGGGRLEFNYNDGDIKEINIPQDEELLQEERNLGSLKEILAALDTGDQVIVAYYDEKQKGTVNTEGIITEKDENNENFSLQIDKINRIELEKKINKQFNLSSDLIIDIEMV